MEGRLTPALHLTKPDRPSTVYERTINTDLDLIDAGVASLDGRLDVIEAAGGPVPVSIVDAKGDLLAGTAPDALARVAVGANGTVLTADATATTGVAWAAAPSANLLVNPGVDIWARGAGAFTGDGTRTADRWDNLVLAGTISTSRDSANADTGSAYCAAVVAASSPNVALRQKLEDYAQLRGRTLTFAVRVKCATGTAVRAALYDTVNGYRYSAYHTGSGVYETLTVTAPIAAATTSVYVNVFLTSATTADVDNAVLVVGSTAPAYAPLHPADDLARCQRYYETLGGGATLERFAMLQCWATTRANGVLAWKVPKAVTPTVTASGPFALQNAAAAGLTVTAVTAAAITPRSCDLDATVGSGLVAGNASLLYANSSLAALIAVEGNV